MQKPGNNNQDNTHFDCLVCPYSKGDFDLDPSYSYKESTSRILGEGCGIIRTILNI